MDKDKISAKNKKKTKRKTPSAKITSLDYVRNKAKDKNKKHKTQVNVYYSFLTIVNMFFESDKKIKKFLIDFITNYDTELAWYVSNNLSLLTNLESKFLVENKIKWLNILQ